MSRVCAKSILLIALIVLVLRAVAGDFQAVNGTDKHWRPHGAHLALSEALHIAEAEALKNEIKFANFMPPRFEYTHEKEQGYVWVFFYQANVPAPGRDFMVVVNDRTQHATFEASK